MDKIIQKAITAIIDGKYERALGILETAQEMITGGSPVNYSRGIDHNPNATVVDLSKPKMFEQPVHVDEKPKQSVNGIQEEVVRSVTLDGEKIDIVKVPQQKRNIIPPGMAGMMLPPDHPLFEQHGAKERKYA